MTDTTEKPDVIQSSYVDIRVRECMRKLDELQWELVQLRNLIQADEEINTNRVNLAGKRIATAVERMTDVNASLIIAASIARGD